MELRELILRGIDFLKAEPIIAIVVLGMVAVLFYFKKKAMLKIVVIFLVIALLYYFITLIGGMTSTGVFQKEKVIEKSQQ